MLQDSTSSNWRKIYGKSKPKKGNTKENKIKIRKTQR